MPKSFKVGVKTHSDADWCYNAMRFPTEEQAKSYGRDLFSRWTAMTDYEAHPCDDEPNVQPDGRLDISKAG